MSENVNTAVATVDQHGGAIIETAASAAAAGAAALIQAQYAVAYRKPRNVEQARVDLLAACKRPTFAEKAIYKKPVGKKQNESTGQWEQNYVEGLSIRAAEEAIRAMHNIVTESITIFENDSLRKKKVMVIDLENNVTFCREISLTKTVEKKAVQDRQTKQWGPPPDRNVISERTNTYGQKVYIVSATEDELSIKEAALTSKIIRTEGLRLVPSDIQEDAMRQCYETMANHDAQDPNAAKRRIIDSFAGVGVKPDQLTEYLGHSLDALTPAELADLRSKFTAIKDGEAKWSDYMNAIDVDSEEPKEPKAAGPKLSDHLGITGKTEKTTKTAPSKVKNNDGNLPLTQTEPGELG